MVFVSGSGSLMFFGASMFLGGFEVPFWWFSALLSGCWWFCCVLADVSK